MHGFTHRMDGRRQAGLALCACIALFIAGSAAHAQGKVHTVVIEAMRYAPEVIEVNAGDTVVWKNRDAFPHTATAQDRSFDSGEIASAGEWKLVAQKKGVFSYVCTLHPTMKASLIVK